MSKSMKSMYLLMGAAMASASLEHGNYPTSKREPSESPEEKSERLRIK